MRTVGDHPQPEGVFPALFAAPRGKPVWQPMARLMTWPRVSCFEFRRGYESGREPPKHGQDRASRPVPRRSPGYYFSHPVSVRVAEACCPPDRAAIPACASSIMAIPSDRSAVPHPHWESNRVWRRRPARCFVVRTVGIQSTAGQHRWEPRRFFFANRPGLDRPVDPPLTRWPLGWLGASLLPQKARTFLIPTRKTALGKGFLLQRAVSIRASSGNRRHRTTL